MSKRIRNSEPSIKKVMRPWRWLLSVSSLLLSMVGCGEGDLTSPTQVPPSQRDWVEEAELLADPSLTVTPRQVVILHLAGTRRGDARVRHVIPYHFEDTTPYTFCMPEHEPHLRAAELFARDAATPLVRIVPGAACETRTIEEGFYRLVIEHDGAGIDDRGRKAFIHVPRLKEEPLTLNTGVAQASPGGLQVCDALAVLTAAQGNYLVRGSGSPNPAIFAQPTSVDLSTGGWQICRDSVGGYEIYLTGPTPQLLSSGVGTQAMFAESNGSLTIHANSTSPYASAFELTDLGDFQFLFSTAVTVNQMATASNPIVVGSDGNLHWTSTGSAQTFGIPIKYYLPGVTPPPLQMGEVALFHGCNYDTTHGTWVVRGNLPDTQGGITGPTTVIGIYYNNPQKGTREFLNQTTSYLSARVGPQTVASFYGAQNYKALVGNIGEDTACDYNFNQFNSIKVTAARDFIIATNYCRNCNLTGIDLSGLDLSAGVFDGSTFTEANLSGTSFKEGIVSGANFSGPSTVLDGANFDDAALSDTNFRGCDLSNASARSSDGLIVSNPITDRADLTGATLDVDTFVSSDWRYLNLTAAQIYNVSGATLSSNAAPVDFSAALMSSVDLHGALLDGANFGCATNPTDESVVCAQLSNANFNRASLKKSSFVNANLQGVNFDFANLDGANLCSAKLNQSSDQQKSASLQGTYMRDVNLYQADLTGANLSNADFYSTNTSGVCNGSSCAPTKCSTAANATLNSATLADSYVAGTDFSDASCKGVDFSRAFLLGANFTGANLSGDNNTGRTTNFRQAYLQGVTLSTASRVTNANFDGAYIATKGASATVKLETENTSFVGFQPNPATAAGCVQFTYPLASATPRTDSGNTCPNGSSGPCTQWVLPTPTPGCSAIDFNWGLAPQ